LEGFAFQDIAESLPDKKGDEPAPPETPPAVAVPYALRAGSAKAKGDYRGSLVGANTPAMQTIKIFLASSSELKGDREQFEIFINRKNKEYVKSGVFLELVLWEDFIDAMSQTRLQDEYNLAIAECDIFVSLFHSKVGQYTKEEFLKAYDTFKANNRPLVYTYFKKLVTEVTRSNRKHFESLFDFQDELSDKGHFYTTYADINDLKHQFSEQLIKILPRLTETDPQ
ncbi:MAG: hypothetical protein ACFB4J_02635, partial [Elainellaceae cyanobacterium]